jgi:hypothetical protein
VFHAKEAQFGQEGAGDAYALELTLATVDVNVGHHKVVPDFDSFAVPRLDLGALLFACAFKYKGKNVHVASGTGRAKHKPETDLPAAALGAVYREDSTGMPNTPIRHGSAKRMKLKELEK